jgi:DNA primase
MRAQGLPRKEIRFTRAELRAASASSDTQLKVHLARLSELEYLLIHRAQRGQGFEYELLFDGASEDASKVLSGLIDVTSLRKSSPTTTDTSNPTTTVASTYDAQRPVLNAARSVSNAAQSGTGRGAVGGVSAIGRVGKTAAHPHETLLPAEIDMQPAKSSATPHAPAQSSYIPAPTQTHTLQPALAA